MPDKRYKTPNGMIVSEQELSTKYGDKLPELLGNNTFTEINETVYTAPNGKKETESVLREKYGDKFEELLSNNTFKVDYEVKKKENSESTFTAKELDSATKDAQSGGSLASTENRYAKGLKFVEKAEQREQDKFDPEGVGYDYETAQKYGIEPDETGHWPSRVPETGQLLKGAKHETFHKTVDGEKSVGNVISKGRDGKYYSFSKEDAPQEVAKKETESWGKNLWRQLRTGSADLGEMMASIPETAYRLAAWPQNAFSELTGIDFKASPEKFKEDYGIKNKVLDFYVAEVEKLEKETDKFNERYDETGIYENIKKGNYSDAFQLLGSGITRSAPVSLAMMAGGATVGTGKLAATATPLFVEGNYQQLKEETPEMSESEATIKALGMAGAETLFESIGTGTIGKVYKDILVKEGAEQAPKIFKQGLIEMYETALKKYGIPASMTGEGIEEVATTITQNMISGKDPFENVADSFLQGVGGGMLYGTPLTVQKAKTAVVEGVARNRVGKTLKDTDYNSIVSVYDFEDNNLDATKLDLSKKDVNRKVLEKELAKEVSNGKIDGDAVTRALENFDRTKKVNSQLEGVELSDNQKTKAASLLFEKQKLEQKVKDKDPHLFSKENARIAEINNELANVRNETTETPKTETATEQATKPEVLPKENEQSAAEPVTEFPIEERSIEYENGRGEKTLLNTKDIVLKEDDKNTFVVSENGNRIGQIKYKKNNDGTAEIALSGIFNPSLEGKGIGTIMYHKVAAELKNKYGLDLVSDTQRTDESEKLWSNLESNGNAEIIGDKTTGKREDYKYRYVFNEVKPTESKEEVVEQPNVKRINPEGVKGEFDVETDANGNVTKILKTDGTEVPKFVERKTPKGKTILAKNANYTKIEAEALGIVTDNQSKIERKSKVTQALDEFTPSNEYEHALDAMARGAKVSLESAQKETGLSAKEVKWATGFNKESDLKSVEALAEDIVGNSEQELDFDEVRNALIDIISSKESIVNLEDEIVSYSEEAQEQLQEQEAQAYLGRLSEKDVSLLEAIEAEDNYISELTDQEAIEYFEQEYEKRIPTEQTGETETNEVGTVESDSVQERNGAQEQEVNLSADLKLPDFIANIDKAIDKLDQFGKETLGLNLPVAVARQALQAMKLAALTAKTVADITSAGINAVKKTKWFKNLNANDQKEIEDNFTDYLNKPYVPDSGKSREQIENEVDGMTGSDQDIIDSFSDSREKMIAEDYLKRKNPVTPEEAKKIVEESYKKADAEINNKGNEKAVNTWFRKLAKKVWDRQFLPKFLLKNAGGTTVRNYIITSKGASGYAKLIYDKAAKKIYKGLSSADVKQLDKIIQERRIIAIDQNRRAMGKPAVVHPDFKNESVSQAYLDEVKKEIGDKKYNDLNKRADVYFETFRGLLDDMYESGIISKQSRDSFFDIDYQPREFLKFLKNAEDELAINEMGRAGTGLASEQIKKLEDGSSTALIYDSQYLLSRAVNVRAKSIAMNNASKKFEQFMREQEKKVAELREKDKPTKKDRKTIKYFEELSKKVKLNPITEFTNNGKPKYLYDKIPKGFKAAYFYTNGVKQMLLMEEKFFDAYTDANKAIWKNQDIKEKAALASGTGLVKALATGNNPTFFLTNTPRDLMFISTFSDAYGSIVPLNIAKLVRDAGKGIRDIYKKNDNFQKFVKYGGMMDYLYQQGEFKGTTGINRVIRKGIDKKVRDRFNSIFEAVTLNQLQMYSEIGFRMAVFNRSVLKQLRENGAQNQAEFEQKFGDDSKDMLDDIYTNAVAAARNTTDFNQGGTVIKDMDAVIPYLNAATQGTRVAVDAFRERPVETTFRAAQSTAMMAAIPTAIGIAALGALRSEDDEDKDLSDTELYIKFKNGVSQYERSNYMLIPTGQRTDKGEFKYIRIAKSQSLSPFLSLAEGLQMDMMKKMVGDKSESTTISDIGFTLEHNVSPFEIGLTNNITKVPFIKASMSYATGYDFFREQDLSYMLGKVPVAAEGYESDQVEDFYKKIGEESGMSPARFKAAVESLITTPSTTPYVGMLYGGMDAMLSDKEGKQVMQKFTKDMLKSTVKRVSKETSDFNRRIADSKFLKEKEAEIEIGQMKVKNEVKRIAERYLLNEITDEQAANEIQELTKDSPFETKRAFNKFKDIIRHPKVPRVVYDLKYADSKLRAIMLVKMFGDGFLEEKDNPLVNDIWANKAVNSETIYEYEKLINQ